MLNNKVINELSSAFAKDLCNNKEDIQIAFIRAQSVFCWLFNHYNIIFKN